VDEHFMEHFMNAARSITRVERGMVVDLDLQVLAAINLDQSTLDSPQFVHLATAALRKALEGNEPLITNNIIGDIQDAPTTNTNFSDLRVIVALPLKGYGALYLDQHIRYGIIPREVIDRLMCLVNRVFPDGEKHYTESELIELYEEACLEQPGI
jgi:hypothetical protein